MTVDNTFSGCTEFAIESLQKNEFLNVEKSGQSCEKQDDSTTVYNQAYCLDVCIQREVLGKSNSDDSFRR